MYRSKTYYWLPSITFQKNKLVNSININKASINELETIPNITEKLANKIIKFREENGDFVYIEDLIYVKGIGEKTFNKIKKYLYIDDN